MDANLVHYRELRVCSSSGSRASHQLEALDMLASKKVSGAALITHRFPPSAFLDALEVMKQKVGLKILMNP